MPNANTNESNTTPATPPQHTSADDKRLSRDVIIAKALEMADADGIENLSMRKLAKAFDKTAMALYRYFDSMAEIQQGVLALAFTEVDTSPIPGERWDDTIRRTTESIRQMDLRHARAHLYLASGAALEPGLREHTEHIQRLHSEQGIPEEILMRGWRIIDAFLTGFIANEIAEMEHASATIDSDAPTWAETVAGAYSEQAFRDGIEIIIAGIRGLAAPDPCEWYTPLENRA